ncbi:hypothetical protein ACFE04_009848 [Oxalis oulophora]
MATNIISFKPVTGIRACASSDHRRSDSKQANWWSPIFGLSNEPDYIDEVKSSSVRNRFAPGCFTAEKAKQLRLMTHGSANFHDVMYHSAIASRLATDLKYGGCGGGQEENGEF